jgi:hypothetical protein
MIETPEQHIARLAKKLADVQVILEMAYVPQSSRKDLCDAISEALDVLESDEEFVERLDKARLAKEETGGVQ